MRRAVQRERVAPDRDVWRMAWPGIGKFWLFAFYIRNRNTPGCRDYFRR
jgi:hypothetical protein